MASLGDTWRIYSSPGEGSLVFTGLTAVVPLRHRPAFSRVYSALLQRFAAGRDASDPSAPRIRQFRFAGRDVYWVKYGSLAPAWCQTDTEFIAALSPQNVKAYLSRRAGAESIAAAPEVARAMSAPDRPAMLGYCDTPKLFELVYPLVVLGAGDVGRERRLRRVGISLGPGDQPPPSPRLRHAWPQQVRHRDGQPLQPALHGRRGVAGPDALRVVDVRSDVAQRPRPRAAQGSIKLVSPGPEPSYDVAD